MKTKKPLLSYEKAFYHFQECSSSKSGLVWKNPTSLRFKPGDPAGSLKPHGYWVVRINKKDYYVHRILYLLRNKKDPGNFEVDHTINDGDKNNKKDLRLANRSQNAANGKKKKYKTEPQSRWKGVYKKRNKWAAQAWLNNKKYHLGCFDKEEQAALAYNVFAQKHFGVYAVLNII